MILYPAIVNPTQTLVREITATQSQQAYRLFISLPQNYSQTTETFPVLYLLDANGTLSLAKSIIEIQQIIQLVPELIIVGVGYPMATYLETLRQRGYDFTHRELTAEEKAEGSYPWDKTGGAQSFLDFLVSELIPFVESEFRIQANNRALAGYSLSGMFALYAMLHQPTTFRRILALSPSSTDEILPIESQDATRHTSLPLKLVLGLECPLDSADALHRTERARHFIKTLNERNYEGLETVFQVFEDIDHFSVAGVGFAQGLRVLYK